jgi:Ca2+-binding RTX toxin-like protein
MDTTAKTITTMGILSDLVYNDKKDQDGNPINFFKYGAELEANGTTYKVIDFVNKPISGLDALLLQDTTTNQYVIAFRGTELKANDILTDLSALTGSIDQIKDAEAWIEELKQNYPINEKNLTLTGHSLGGILTQAVGADLGIQGYAFNPWGTNVLTSLLPDTKNVAYDVAMGAIYNFLEKVLAFVGVESGKAAFAKNNILNISYQDDGKINGDILSNFATGLVSSHLGSFLPIWGENVGLSGHSIGVLNNAIAEYNILLKSFDSSVDFRKLSAMFCANAFTNVEDYERTRNNIAEILNGGKGYDIDVLTGKSYDYIISLAKTNASYAYALERLNAFVLTGLSYGHLVDKYDLDVDYNQRSESYLHHRIDFLINRDESIFYLDTKLGLSAGVNSDVLGPHRDRIVFTDSSYEYNNAYGKSYTDITVYGSDKANIITAKSRANNYVEGGLGNDVITTGMGDDTIYTNANIASQYDKETSSTVNKVYAGDGDDTVYGSNGIDVIYADSDNSSDPEQYSETDTVEGRGGSDVIYGGGGNDYLYADRKTSHSDTSGDYIVGGRGKDTIDGSDGDDTIYGDNVANNGNGIPWHDDIFSDRDTINAYGGNDIVHGGNDRDTIIGGDGSDVLFGGDDGDIIIGGFTKDQVDAFTDYLYGGEGTDTYISGDSDHIRDDDDGEGRVYFENKLLTGGTKKAGAGCEPTEDNGDSLYYGDGGVYRLSGNTLTFTKNGKILTIEEYQKRESGYVGITLKDNPGDGDACPSPTHDCPKPVNPLFNFNFSLPTPTVSIGGGGGGGTYYGGGGGGGGSYTHNTSSTPHRTPTPPAPELPCPNLPTHHSAGTGGGGGGTPPIVLDLNRNGITSISMAASIALFDYDGDGIKENTAWIESGDALLVNDVNNDGIINNASELFGNYTRNSDGSVAKSGYQALSYYDTNGDSVVDASDSRFEELKLWIDSDQDGVTDTGELKTLSEMGVTSLKLNDPITPYIPTTENTNTIIQETTFTDAQGEGIMRDVLFRYENTSTNTDGVYFDMDGNGIKEKMLTWTDPNEWMVVKDINGELEGTDTPIYTGKSNNNYYKQKIFTNNNKIDTINNCFYMFKIKVA